MKLSYVLPDPSTYRDWSDFDGDLACMKKAGYDAVELQIADPALFDEDRVRRSLQARRLCDVRLPNRFDLCQPRQLPLHGRRNGPASNDRTSEIVRRSGVAMERRDRVRLAARTAAR